MKKPFCLTALFLMLSVALCFSQLTGSDGQSNMSSLANGSMFRSFDNRFKGIEGSPLLFETYKPGKVILSGQTITNKKINYDAFTKELLVMNNNAEMIVKKAIVKEFAIYNDEDTLLFKKFEDEKNGFFLQEITHDKIRLYKEVIKNILNANNTGPYSTGKSHSEFETTEKFYWSTDFKSLKEVKNKKTLVGQFNSNNDNLANFIKENKIDFKQQEDLVKVFQYLNSI